VNRWYAGAVGVLVVGLAIAFVVVPFDNGGCPTAFVCDAVGAVPRIATIAVAATLALVLAVVGSMGSERGRRR
jgi:hypothetical protein